MRHEVRRYLYLFAAWAVFRAVERNLLGPGFGSDPFLYFQYARTWGAGAAPYLDFHPEYPPAALLLFVGPFLVGGGPGYFQVFQLEMAGFDFAAIAAVFAFATRLWPDKEVRQIAAAAAYLVATAALHPVLLWRYDIAPAALTIAALYFAATRREIAGAVLLGLGGSVKLWPLALAPLWLGSSVQSRGWRSALREAAAMGAGVVIPLCFFVPRARLGIFGFLQFQSERVLQIESWWANLALLADAVGLAPARITYNHGAFNVEGGLATALRAVARIAAVLLVFAPQIIALRPRGLAAGELPARTWLDVATASVLGILVGTSVLSPQFMIWIVPLLVLSEAPGIAAAIAIAAFTTAVYPWLYDPLVLRQPPRFAIALACLSARNVILAAAYVVLVRRLVLGAARNSVQGGKPDIAAAAT
jgi:Glycosyltransferase family 87